MAIYNGEVVVNRSIKNFHKFVKAVDIMTDTNAFRTKGKRGTALANYYR